MTEIDVATPEPGNPFQRMLGVFLAPVETLRSISARPDFLITLVVIVLISVVTSIISAPHIDIGSSLRSQFEKQGLSEQQIDRAIDVAEKFQKFSAPLTAAILPVLILVIAGLPFIAFKLFGAGGAFKQFFAIATYAWLPQVLRAVLFTAIVSFKQTLTIEEVETILKSSPAFLVSMSDQPALFTLLSQLDFFNIWTVALLAIGVAFATGVSRSKAGITIVSLWLTLVLIRTGLAALQGLGGGS